MQINILRGVSALNMLKFAKKDTKKKYWKPKNEQERLERTLHNNMHQFPEKQEKQIINKLMKLMNSHFIGCKHQGNQIFINPEEMKDLKEIFENQPESMRRVNRELGKAFMMQWFESQLTGVA